MKEWRLIKDEQPPEGVAVKTKIHDKQGCRNEATLIRKGSLYFLQDMSMYVYYSPTHWKEL